MAEELDLAGIDLHAMFEAKMGFLAEDVPLDDTQLEKFLLLCHQAYLEQEGLMDEEVEEETEVKVVKVNNGNIHDAMNQILGSY